MSQPPWAYRGAYIPFPLPVPAITDDPLSSEDNSLCWSDAWTPAILGALKVLARPETWTGSDTDIALAMEGAQELLASIIDGCGGAAEIPFACPGDLSASDAPWGTWTINNVGVYVVTQGYGPTLGMDGSQWYYGADVAIHFLSPINIDTVHVVYDMIKDGTTTPANDAIAVYDVTNAAFLAPPVLFSGLVDGNNQAYNAGASSAPLSDMRVFVMSGTSGSSFIPSGNMRIDSVDITGHTTPGGPSPC